MKSRIVSRLLVAVLSTAALVLPGRPTVADGISTPTFITIPSVVTDTPGSSTSATVSYFWFNSVQGTSYLIAPERVDPVTGEPNAPASFTVSIVTYDSVRSVVAQGQASNGSPFITPPLQSGPYLIYVDDGFARYSTVGAYTLRTAVASVGGTPVGPVPGSVSSIGVATLSTPSLSIPGGTTAPLTITLNAPAPSGGVRVALSSNSSAVSVPAEAFIPAGSVSTTVNLTTTTVRKSTGATITARVGTNSRALGITVTR